MTERPAARARDSIKRPIDNKIFRDLTTEWGYLCDDTKCGKATHYHYKDRQGAERRIREKKKGTGDPPKEVNVDDLIPCLDVKRCVVLQHAHYHLYCEPCSEVPTRVEVAAHNVVQLPTTCGGGVTSQVYEMMTPVATADIPFEKCQMETQEQRVIVENVDASETNKKEDAQADDHDDREESAFSEIPDSIDTTEETIIYVNPDVFKKNAFETAWNFVANILGLVRMVELPDAQRFNQFIHSTAQSSMIFNFFGHPVTLYREEHKAMTNGSVRGYRAYYKAEVYSKLYQFLITEVFQVIGLSDTDISNKFLAPRLMSTVTKNVNAAWYSDVKRLEFTLNTVFAVLNYKFHEGHALYGHMGVSHAVTKSKNPFSSLNFQS